MAKWVYEAMMAGCSVLKLGYVTRRNDKPILLAVHSHRVMDLAAQMGLKPASAWGFARELLDIILCDMAAEGEYIITRDPLQPQLKIHYNTLATVLEGDEVADDCE